MFLRYLTVIDRLIPESLFLETVPDFSIVMAKEFGPTGIHVHIVRFAFGTLFVQELENGIISGLILDQDTHDDEQRFP